MDQEGRILGHKSSGGDDGGDVGGSGCMIIAKSPKKVKQKKVPQRGLGVAQLEKIRLEEQQKRESLESTNVVVDSPNDGHRIQCPNFRAMFNSMPMPIPSPMVSGVPSPNVMYRHEYSVPILKLLSRGGGEMGSKMVLSPGHGTQPYRPLNGECDLEKQRFNHHHHELRFEAQTSLSRESNDVVLPVAKRSHQFQQNTSLMVNSFSGILQSSILNSQTEPPSNQSSRSDNYTHLWSEEDKIVGVKRPYPFYHECPQAPSFNRNHSHVASLSRSDELVSRTNGYTEPRTKYMRESSPNPSHPPEATADKDELNENFLTLAPPTVALPLSNSKHKQPLDDNDNQIILGQEYSGRRMHQPGPSGLVKESFSFFPLELRINQSVSNENDEKAETIDLELKL